MNALRFALLLGTSLVLTVACGSAADSGADPATGAPTNPPTSGDDAGGGGDGAPSTTPTSDAAVDANADAADATVDPNDLTKPHPPAGATICGGGAITASDFANTCNAPSILLDNWQGKTKFSRSCGAVTFASADYQVWCTADAAYAFVHYTGLRATGTLTCMNGTRMLLGALYESGNGGGDTGINLKSGYRGAPNQTFDAQMPIDAYTWITVSRASKAARIYLTPTPEPLGQCGDIASGFRTLVGGAAVTWQ